MFMAILCLPPDICVCESKQFFVFCYFLHLSSVINISYSPILNALSLILNTLDSFLKCAHISEMN
jgi:hypothetical protein